MLKSALILFLLLITSCGFHSIYQAEKDDLGNINYKTELAAIAIEKGRKHIDQQFQSYLEDFLNPHAIKIEPKYSLSVSINESLTSTFTTSTGSSGRNKVILNVSYTLKNLENGTVIATGLAIAKDDFDVNTSRRFANYTAEESISLNLTKIAAMTIRNMLINDIINKDNKNKKEIKAKNTKALDDGLKIQLNFKN